MPGIQKTELSIAINTVFETDELVISISKSEENLADIL